MSDWTHDFHDFSRNVSEIDGDHDEFDLLLVSHDSRVERPREDVSLRSEFRTRLLSSHSSSRDLGRLASRMPYLERSSLRYTKSFYMM